jgi:hypothetical protein
MVMNHLFFETIFSRKQMRQMLSYTDIIDFIHILISITSFVDLPNSVRMYIVQYLSPN